MESEKLISLLIDVIVASQAFSVGLFLILLNRREKNEILLLGSVLIAMGVSTTSTIIADNYNDLVLNLELFILVPVFLYAYVDSVSILKKNRWTKAVLTVGITSVLAELTIGILGIFYNYVFTTIAYKVFLIFNSVFIVSLLIITYLKARQHTKVLKNQYSSTENRNLIWVSNAIILMFALHTIIPFANLFFHGLYSNISIAVFWLFFTFWGAYHGLLQQVSKNLIPKTNTQEKQIVSTEIKQHNTKQNSEQYQVILNKIETLLKEEELFLNSDFTIINLADLVKEHPRLVSQIINTIKGQNFNAYINQYRVKHAQNMLQNPENKHLNIEVIGNLSGFKSNSAFYTAFKKQLNITPLQFLKKHRS